MGKQYNKLIKRRRRNAYNVRKKIALAEKTQAKARPAKKAAAAAPAAPVPAAAPTA
jgi:hypothetical protein